MHLFYDGGIHFISYQAVNQSTLAHMDVGIDYIGRKTIVFSACHLPNPNDFDYDFLLK